MVYDIGTSFGRDVKTSFRTSIMLVQHGGQGVEL